MRSSAALQVPPHLLPASKFARQPVISYPSPKFPRIRLIPKTGSHKTSTFKSFIDCIHTSELSSHAFKSTCRDSDHSLSSSAITGTPVRTLSIACKLQCLVSEFRSLPEPIDRVKRLLYYANLLPPVDQSARVQANRVTGCTAEVWLELEMDVNGLMRFKMDSDSEIAKGFCWCLIWLLDGSMPEELLKVKTEDLADINVGFNSAARSRVNTWHNVLINMQKRTKAMVEERVFRDSLPATVVASDGISANRNFDEVQVCCPCLC